MYVLKTPRALTDVSSIILVASKLDANEYVGANGVSAFAISGSLLLSISQVLGKERSRRHAEERYLILVYLPSSEYAERSVKDLWTVIIELVHAKSLSVRPLSKQ